MTHFTECVIFLFFIAGEADDIVDVVRLHLGFVCRAIPFDRSALVTSVDDDISFFRIRLSADWAHDAAAGIGAVAGIHVHMQGAEATGAVVA